MKKVLIITYYWPPVSSPGVQRWLKFAKYLPEFGIQPVILTVNSPSAPSFDSTLADDLPQEIDVYKTTAFEPTVIYNWLIGKRGQQSAVGLGDIQTADTLIKRLGKYLRSNIFIPDAKIGWYYAARKKAVRLVKDFEIKTVISTGPPHTAHLLGKYVATHSEVSWIADFRDPWTGLYYEKYLSRSESSRKKNAKLEHDVLATCDQVLTVSNGMKESFKHIASNIAVLPNGYDKSDLPSGISGRNSKCTVLYTGNLKANQNIPAFWKAIAALQENPKYKDAFALRIIGNIDQSIFQTIEKYGIGDIAEFKPFVPHVEAVSEMMKADLLFLPIPLTDGNKSIITGKIFEYLASRTPILAIGPIDGDASAILAECGRASMIGYENEQSITQQLINTIEVWWNGSINKIEGDAHTRYERKSLTKVLASKIQEI